MNWTKILFILFFFSSCESSCDPREVNYPIPSNDDASKSINVILSYVSNAINNGLLDRKKEKETEDIIKEKELNEEKLKSEKVSSDDNKTNEEISTGEKKKRVRKTTATKKEK